MVAIAAVFQVCLAAPAKTMETSLVLVTTAFGGVPRLPTATPGTADSTRPAQSSIGATPVHDAVSVYVAFEIERVTGLEVKLDHDDVRRELGASASSVV